MSKPQASKRWRTNVRDGHGRAPRGLRKEESPNARGAVIDSSFPDYHPAPTNHCPTPRKRSFDTEQAAARAVVYNPGGTRHADANRFPYRCPEQRCGKWHLAGTPPRRDK